MSFLRFAVARRHAESQLDSGLLAVAYAVCRSDDFSDHDRQSLSDLLDWFERNLPVPGRFNRSTSKGFYRRNAKGIAWFRDTAVEHVNRMHQIKQIIEAHGHVVRIIKEDRVGYIVFEDDVQVIAEPFADTETDV